MKEPIRDCYPCYGRGFISYMEWTIECTNCRGTGVSPTWEMSDGSDLSKKPVKPGLSYQYEIECWADDGGPVGEEE